MADYLSYLRKIGTNNGEILKKAGSLYESSDSAESFIYPQDLFTADSAPFILFFAVHPTKPFVILDKIALYMPRNLLVQYGISYSEMSNPIEQAKNALSWDTVTGLPGRLGVEGGAITGAATIAGAIGGYVVGGVKGAAAGAGLAGTATAGGLVFNSNRLSQLSRAVSVATKEITNPHQAVVFEGVQFRRHDFTFDLIARNKEESDVINRIIYKFKYHAHPSAISTNPSVYWQWPSNFNIGLFSPARKYLYNISTSFLTNISVDYMSGGQRSFFADTGAPVAVRLGLQFMETEVLTRERIEQGF